jgi:hypothetical protein
MLVLTGMFLVLQMQVAEVLGDMVMPSGDVIIQWNTVSLNAIKTAQYTSVKASRTLAMVHVAMFDAINSIDKTCQPYFVDANPAGPASRDVAAAVAAHDVLVSLFPSQSAGLDTTLNNFLAGIPDSMEKTNGIALGQDVGGQIIALRLNDHSSDMVPYTPGTDPGDWQPTPPGFAPAMLPNWAIVTPFAMTSNSQFRPVVPPDLTSAQYTADFNEVKTLGASTGSTRTMEQSDIAMFWMDMPGTITTVGRWNLIAQQVANNHATNLWQNARLFALLNITLADAGIVAWDCKYQYSFWRPITAIRAADTDGNPLTDQDAVWTPLIMTPAFPEYVSAHSTFSAAAAQVLADYFNDDNISFTIDSFMMPTMTRLYRSFTDAAKEAGMSRIYGGIHFHTADMEGQAAGRNLAKYVLKNFLTVLNARLDTDGIDTDGDGDPDNDVIYKRLAAGDGFVNMADKQLNAPGGKLQYIFSFSDITDVPDNMAMHHGMLAAEFSAPTIKVKEGQIFFLSLTNVGMMMRPDLFDPHSVHWHGFPNAAPVFDGVPDSSVTINMGGTFTYYYNIAEEGTFIYHCHVEATEHMQMGMLGNLYVLAKQNNLSDGSDLNGFTHHAGYQYAYNDSDGSTYYDVDYPIQLSGFDPVFHDEHIAVQPLPFALMKDKYGMINGRGYPDTIDPNVLYNTASDFGLMDRPSQKINSLITVIKGERVLLRMTSLSTVDYFTVTTLGIPMRVVGTGSRLLRGPDGKDTSYLTSSVTLGGGETIDVILDTADIAPGTYFLYTTNLNFLSNDKEDFGGIMTEIVVHDGQGGIAQYGGGGGAGGGAHIH